MTIGHIGIYRHIVLIRIGIVYKTVTFIIKEILKCCGSIHLSTAKQHDTL